MTPPSNVWYAFGNPYIVFVYTSGSHTDIPYVFNLHDEARMCASTHTTFAAPLSRLGMSRDLRTYISSTKRSRVVHPTRSDVLAVCVYTPRKPSSLYNRHDPQPGVVREQYPRTAMCVRNVDVHVSCSSQVDAQLAAFFIDPRAK